MGADFVLLVAAFVDVVAHKQHQIEVLRSHVAVRCIVALLVMLTRRQTQTQAAHGLI